MRKQCSRLHNITRGLFGDDASLEKLREQYAMNAGSLKDKEDLQALPAFFFGQPGLLQRTAPAKPMYRILAIGRMMSW